FIGWGNALGEVWILVVGKGTAFIVVELEVHRAGLPFLVEYVLQLDGFAFAVIPFLFVAELNVLPLADGAYLAVIGRPTVLALLGTFAFLSLCGVAVLPLLFSRAASAAGNELDSALFDIHLQGDGKLATVLQLYFFAFERRTCQQQG
ncbi:hypothetical protein HMPREF9151_02079, partial [Hoylesella saccharolytica F0055]